MKALIIDDSPLNLVVAKAILIQLGFDVSEALDPHLGLRIFESEDFDLILTDFNMPGLNGIDVILALRSIEKSQGRNKSLMIAASAEASPDLAEKFHMATADFFFPKPLSLEKLQTAIQSYFLKKSG